MKPFYLSIICMLLFGLKIEGQSPKSKNFLYRIQNADEESGYVNKNGDTVIPIGKYLMCQDEVIKEIGFVLSTELGFIAINCKDSVLFQVFNYDNGPDIPSNGLFRIVKDGKIGYANMHGKIIAEPQFKCAWPYEKGYAKVSYNCNIRKDGEYDFWEGGDWFFIDKKGKKKKI